MDYTKNMLSMLPSLRNRTPDSSPWTSRFTDGVDWEEFTDFGSYNIYGEWIDPVPTKAYPGWWAYALTAPQYILKAIGSWATGFRPTKFRVTWETTGGDGTMDWLGIKYGNFTQAFEVDDSSSGTEHDLSLSADLAAIEFISGSQYEVPELYVTNIEFYYVA